MINRLFLWMEVTPGGRRETAREQGKSNPRREALRVSRRGCQNSSLALLVLGPKRHTFADVPFRVPATDVSFILRMTWITLLLFMEQITHRG